ncbi:putative cytosolic phospholipase A2 [Cladophialophora carrionii]|uniref:Lysophospholipase n=1 Tax=Cladophialophora carrionii TaxID=86049 RepID=A0A1C1CQM2_9EURO|nr:putative cytosolic phospholipase A2 [Cladophialophora carrionii]
MATTSPNQRTSETTEQQEYEHAILRQHYPDDKRRLDLRHLAGDEPGMPVREGEDGSDGKDEDGHERRSSSPLAGSSGARAKVKGKLKSFWNKTVVPAFPEAIADISIIKAALKVEATITKDLRDTSRHPEVAQSATVRRGFELAPEEMRFRDVRKVKVRDAFCRYLGLDPAEVHVDDVPIVAFGGSGGGYRAMIGMLGYGDEMKRSGLWDVLTYVSGVSGSCWSLAAYYTWAGTSMDAVIRHCKQRLHPHHPLSPEAIREVLHAPGGPSKTLGPLVQKHRTGLSTVAMDLYSVFTTGHLFLVHDPALEPPGSHGRSGVKKEVAGQHEQWFKWSSANAHLVDGHEPLPILTAIRHERPWKDWVDQEHPFKDADPGAKEHEEAQDAWFNWFEISPIEVGCDELEAWCPTWAFGRPFEKGRDTMQIPEQSLALLLGLCTSAPAGPLTSYLATIKRSLPSGFIGNSINDMAKGVARMWGEKGTEEFQAHHPLHAVNEHNFMFHLSKGENKDTPSPPIENSPRIHLIDSGMDNNCPTYVMLHPRRNVDVILNMDASSDVLKGTFQDRVDQIASRRCLKFTKRYPELQAGTDPKNPDQFQGLYAQIYDGSILVDRPGAVVDSYGHTVTNPPAPPCLHESTMIYLPLLPNQGAVADFDPSTAKFSGSYNLVWTPDQVEMLVRVCCANFKAGEETIKTVLREQWLKKRAKREAAAASVLPRADSSREACA